MDVVMHFCIPEEPLAVVISIDGEMTTDKQMMKLVEVLKDPEVQKLLGEKMK